MRIQWLSCFAMACLLMLCGCEPEETFVAVKASELRKAASGELGTAKVEMVFDVQDKDDLQLPNKIRKAALPYLGEGAVIDLEKTEKRKVKTGGSIRDEDEEVEVKKSLDGAKLVARFNIPVGTSSALASAPRSIMWLMYSSVNKTFNLVNGNCVKGLNSALARVNDSVSYEFTGGVGDGILTKGTIIKIINDEPVKVGVAAVKVDGENIISGTVAGKSGSTKISYNNSFYKGKSPCFVWGEFPTMKFVQLKDDDALDED